MTGLYKFGIRYYDPTLGHCTQQDPLGGSLFDPSTGNRYAYPTNLTDLSGAGCGRTAVLYAAAGIAAEIVTGPVILGLSALFATTAVVVTAGAIVDASIIAGVEGGIFGAVSGCVVGSAS